MDLMDVLREDTLNWDTLYYGRLPPCQIEVFSISQSLLVNKNEMLKCNYRCSVLSRDFSTNCAPNFIQNTDLLQYHRK